MTIGNLLRKKIGLFDNKKIIFFYNLGLTPLRATALSIIFKFITLYFLFMNNLIFAGIAMVMDHIFDGLDGMIARAINKTTKLGEYLDKGSDYIIRRAGYFILAFNGFFSYKLALITVVLIFINPLFLYIIDLSGFKRRKNLPTWGDAFLIFFALFTGRILFFFYLIIATSILFFIINVSSITYSNLKK